MQELIVLAHVPTPSINQGFLPAARALGLRVVLLTDHAETHRGIFSQDGLDAYPDEIHACDVFNPLAVIEAIGRRALAPSAVFSNSDHLQTSTAIAAGYFGCAAKDWRVCYRAKNKAQMRAFLANQGIDVLWHGQCADEDELKALAPQIPFPCVAKPSEGVASQWVKLCHDEGELLAFCKMAWKSSPGRVMVIEPYLAGPLYTLETLGDGTRLDALGGFRVTLSPPPHFVEQEAHWESALPPGVVDAVLDQIQRFGVNFGACHTEFVLTEQGPRLIEINYRSIGDRRDFLLAEILESSYFEQVLRLHLGERLDGHLVASMPAKRTGAIRYFVADRGGEVVSAPEPFAQADDGVSLRYQGLVAPGNRLTLSHSNKDYLGVLSGVAPDPTLLEKAFAAACTNLRWEFRG